MPSKLCPACQKEVSLPMEEELRFCPFCGSSFAASNPELLSNRYQLIKSIGKGGMGEVFLAFDTACERHIALKRIRTDLLEHPQIRHRFLKEAHITCQLTHPAIIPIYSIQADHPSAYYTMPFVEGETLKQIIRKTWQQEKKGEKINQLGSSIPALMRIFITICQAVAYAHAKGVLHRDLKPENIIVGTYGEVLILDWGLAKFIHTPAADEETPSPPPAISSAKNKAITRLGKVVGTVAYMAPERALGAPSTIQTDIYALGVILYQLLTLKPPFKRGTLKEYRQQAAKEEWIDPVVAAPYRDVPRGLARLVEKCLNPNPQLRHHAVDEMIHVLESYLEGRSEWQPIAELNVKKKSDWEFQEHVLLAEHVAINRIAEAPEWVALMISAQSFPGNIRIETSVRLKEHGHGIGLLLSIPEADERIHINDGYCLWLGSDLNRSTQLMRSTVEVMHAPDIYLKRDQWMRIRIEKIDKTIHLYLDNILQFSYIAHIPLIGTHIGLLSRDADYEIEPILISVGSLNLMVNCLAVPDAFLAHQDFTQALSEYRRIAYSFPDRVEGREALFRAGLTFIEQAKAADNKVELLESALQEFEKLHGTPGGPLEYLGKALVYEALQEEDEEIKCFEIAYRRYPKHPLLPVLQEQILSRMHKVSRTQRITTYRFILLVLRHFPPAAIDTHTRRLLVSIQKHAEPLPFIEEASPKPPLPHTIRLSIAVAFWLAEPLTLGEIFDNLVSSSTPAPIEIGNILACLVKLSASTEALQKLTELKSTTPDYPGMEWEALERLIALSAECPASVLDTLLSAPWAEVNFSKMRTWLHAIDLALDNRQTPLVFRAVEKLKQCSLLPEAQLQLHCRLIWALLLEKKWKEANQVFHLYPIDGIINGSSPLQFLYGCWLQGTQGKEAALMHFMGLMHSAYPRSWALAGHYLFGELPLQGQWFDQAFRWEKRELYRYLTLYYHCSGDEILFQKFNELYDK